jgi:hypothetical protein
MLHPYFFNFQKILKVRKLHFPTFVLPLKKIVPLSILVKKMSARF